MTCMCLLPAYLTSRNILKWKLFSRTWGSTGKEVERSSFWIEGGFFLLCRHVSLVDIWRSFCLILSVPRIWQRFKLSFIICFAAIAMMIIFTTNVVPFEWQIPGWNWALIIPLSLVVGCHILLPVSLTNFFSEGMIN
jgi:hypothetical protein